MWESRDGELGNGMKQFEEWDRKCLELVCRCRKSRYSSRNGIEYSGNDKLKEWREVKIIENEHIC